MKKTISYFVFLLIASVLVFPSSVFSTTSLPPPTATLTASPNPIYTRSVGSTVLSWSSTYATSCSVTQGGKSGFTTGGATAGSDSSDPISVSTTFAISCTGSSGTATASVVVNINVEDTTPTATLTASPNPVSTGGATTLTWASTYATLCSVTQGSSSGFTISGGATSGSDTSSNLINATTFAISCTGTGGSATDSVTVNVNNGDDDDDGGGGGGGGGSSNDPVILMLMEKLIGLLQQYLALLLAAQGQ
ncbi:MAG: hypothetical protein NUW02_03465 [Candidatus Campbellbacteria bacterium]|nr:hypothetical protein [Candidatus Campbellbacteria bacterium]